MSQRTNGMVVEYVITYLSLGGRELLTTKYKFFTKFLGLTRELNPVCISEHIRGLRDNGGQSGLPGGMDEGFIGTIIMECKHHVIRRVLKFTQPLTYRTKSG